MTRSTPGRGSSRARTPRPAATADERPPLPALDASRLASLRDAATSGAALLDRRVPFWAASVDVRSLDMMSLRSCVLAQVAGTYTRGLAAAGLPVADEGAAASFGFTLATCDTMALDAPTVAATLGALTRIWSELICARVAWSAASGITVPFRAAPSLS